MNLFGNISACFAISASTKIAVFIGHSGPMAVYKPVRQYQYPINRCSLCCCALDRYFALCSSFQLGFCFNTLANNGKDVAVGLLRKKDTSHVKGAALSLRAHFETEVVPTLKGLSTSSCSWSATPYAWLKK